MMIIAIFVNRREQFFFPLRFFPSHRSSLLELMKKFLFRVCFCRIFFLLHVCKHFVAFDFNRSEMF